MPVVGAGLRQRGPNWKATICTRNMVSFRLGQSPREMRGRMRAPQVLESGCGVVEVWSPGCAACGGWNVYGV